MDISPTSLSEVAERNESLWKSKKKYRHNEFSVVHLQVVVFVELLDVEPIYWDDFLLLKKKKSDCCIFPLTMKIAIKVGWYKFENWNIVPNWWCWASWGCRGSGRICLGAPWLWPCSGRPPARRPLFDWSAAFQSGFRTILLKSLLLKKNGFLKNSTTLFSYNHNSILKLVEISSKEKYENLYNSLLRNLWNGTENDPFLAHPIPLVMDKEVTNYSAWQK